VNPEEAMVFAFIGKDKRDRYLAFLGSAKGRKKLREMLAHGTVSHLNPAMMKSVPPKDHSIDGIYALLKSRGAPELCRVISEDTRLDGRDMPLREALEAAVGAGMGTLIGCVPGRLAYFEGEDIATRFLLEK
jgi:hypothetical protein